MSSTDYLPERSTREVLTAELDGLEVALLIRRGLNFALAHAGITPFEGLLVNNATNVDIEDATIEVTIDAPTSRPVAQPIRMRLPHLEPGAKIPGAVDGRHWRLDPVAMASIEEAVPATLTLRLSRAGASVTEQTQVDILARDEWSAVVPETVASFVMPRDRGIHQIVSRASDMLGERTDDPSLQGYQASRERTLQIAEAVWDAFCELKIRYSEPPASFEVTGQKIRRPSEVIEDRFGTCLDLAVTYSAALEYCGLFPVMFRGIGHAFGGFITEERPLDELVMTDVSKVTNWIDSGLVVPIETTRMCVGTAGSMRDAAASAAAHGWWSHAPEDFTALVDIHSAHRHGVKPLPVVRTDDTGRVVEVDASTSSTLPSIPGLDAPAPRRPAQPAPDTPRGGERVDQQFPPRVARWRNQLLDLSLRNPLLNMSSRGKGHDLHIPAGSLGRLEDLVFDGTQIKLIPNDQIAQVHRERGARSAQDIDAEQLAAVLEQEHAVFAAVTQDAYAKRLRDLHRSARTIFEETGANNLFLTLGSLRWNDGSKDLRSPLFLLPIKLTAQRRGPFRPESVSSVLLVA